MKTNLVAIICLITALYPHSISADTHLGYQGQSNRLLTPQALLTKLKSDNQTTFIVENDWTIASSKKLSTIWSFAPHHHAAYPSYIQRALIKKNSHLFMKTDVKCGAQKPICDQLVQDFMVINEKLQKQINARQNSTSTQ